MGRTYATRTCHTCGEAVKTAGLPMTAHMRKHVREGLLVEIQPRFVDDTRGRREFVAPEEGLKRLVDPQPHIEWILLGGTLPEA